MATIQPQLETGVDTGWDLIVLTDWMAAKVDRRRLGRGDRPGQHRRPPWPTSATSSRACPGTRTSSYHFPWQSVATGLGYNACRPGAT